MTHHGLKFIIIPDNRLQFISYIFFQRSSPEWTEVGVAVPSLYILSVFLFLFVTHKIFSRSTGPPAERETRPVLMDLPPIKFRQQQFLNRGLGLKRKSFMTTLKSYRNIF